MRTAGGAIGPRRFAGLAAALALALLGAACAGPRVDSLAGPLTLPPAPPALTEFDPSAEGVEVAPPEGTAGPMAKLLARSVVEGLGRYNVPAMVSSAAPPVHPGANPGVESDTKSGAKSDAKPSRFLLTGQAGPNRDPALNAMVAIEWRVFDRRGNREIGRFVDGIAADRFAWDNGDPRVIHAVGENAAHGFSTLVMKTSPVVVTHGPAESRAPKSVAAPRESTVAAAPRESTIVASLSSDPARSPVLASGVLASSPAKEPPLYAPPGGGKPAAAAEGTLLFTVPVSGAPGDGNGALTRGIRAALATRGYALADTPRAARYLLAGSVALGKAEAGRQPVRIVWEVTDAQGQVLGRAVQENDVAAGSLNGAWGPIAAAVAGAAVPGIADVVRRSQAAADAPPPEPSERRLKIPPTTALPPIPDHAMLPPG